MKAKYLIILIMFFNGCKKSDLDIKPDKSLFIPTTLQDLQALLDNDGVFIINQPALGEVGADNYYLSNDVFQSLYEVERNAYVWAKDIYGGELSISDWDVPYQQIYYANTVLEDVVQIQESIANQNEYDNVKGSALFDRAYAFYNLSQVFTKGYDATSANTDLGLPLRLSSDFNIPVNRSTVQQTYYQLINDAREAASLLPVKPLGISRPSKPSAFALLTRTYLAMQNYDSAFLYADSSLRLYHVLNDFNSLDTTADYPFPSYGQGNNEILYQSSLSNYSGIRNYGTIDSDLYRSYAKDDLRKAIFFTSRNGNIVFKGSYMGSRTLFGGIAVDEMYLVHAECNARKGNIENAMHDLNTLLETRWKAGSFVPYIASDANDALIKVLQERRKELLLRGLRWTDLRRLNKETSFATTLKRVVDGVTYTLPPNDNRYVYPIPNDEILYNNIEQNPR